MIRITRKVETLSRTADTSFVIQEIFYGDRYYEVTDDPNPPFEKRYVESQTDVIVYFVKGDVWVKEADIAEIVMFGETKTGVVYKIVPYQSLYGATPRNRSYECHIILDK